MNILTPMRSYLISNLSTFAYMIFRYGISNKIIELIAIIIGLGRVVTIRDLIWGGLYKEYDSLIMKIFPLFVLLFSEYMFWLSTGSISFNQSIANKILLISRYMQYIVCIFYGLSSQSTLPLVLPIIEFITAICII